MMTYEMWDWEADTVVVDDRMYALVELMGSLQELLFWFVEQTAHKVKSGRFKEELKEHYQRCARAHGAARRVGETTGEWSDGFEAEQDRTSEGGRRGGRAGEGGLRDEGARGRDGRWSGAGRDPHDGRGEEKRERGALFIA